MDSIMSIPQVPSLTHDQNPLPTACMQSMMVDPTVLMKGIEEDPSLLEELAALSGEDGGGAGDAGLKGGWVGGIGLWVVCIWNRPARPISILYHVTCILIYVSPSTDSARRPHHSQEAAAGPARQGARQARDGRWCVCS